MYNELEKLRIFTQQGSRRPQNFKVLQTTIQKDRDDNASVWDYHMYHTKLFHTSSEICTSPSASYPERCTDTRISISHGSCVLGEECSRVTSDQGSQHMAEGQYFYLLPGISHLELGISYRKAKRQSAGGT